MLRFRSRISVIVIIVLTAALIAGWMCDRFHIPQGGYFEFVANPLRGMSRFRGYCAGAVAAIRDLEKDKAVHAAFGEMSLVLHKSSGLEVLSLGCVTDDGLEAYVDGYNRVIDLRVRWRGIPRNSRRQWEFILQNPDLYFQRQTSNGVPLSLIVDGPPIPLPNGSGVASVKTLKHSSDKSRIVGYELKWGSSNVLLLSFWPTDNVFGCVPGPDGSDFLLLRGRRMSAVMTLVFDLRYSSEISLENTNLP